MFTKSPAVRNTLIYIFISVALILFAIYYANKINPRNFAKKTEVFQSVLIEKELHAKRKIIEIEEQLLFKSVDSLFLIDKYTHQYGKDGILFLIFEDSILRYWSDNSVPVFSFYNDNNFNSDFGFFSNAWFEIIKKEAKQFVIIALIKIKNAYTYENQFLNNDFHEDFMLSSNTSLSSIESSYNIYNDDGIYLFSLVFSEKSVFNETQSLVITSIYLIAFIFIILTLYQLYNLLIPLFPNKSVIWLAYIFDILLIRFVTFYFEIPKVLYSFHLFSPSIFASSRLLPSLGDLLINSVLLVAISIVIFKKFDIRFWLTKFNKISKYINAFILLLFVFLLFAVLSSSLISIITNSNISFDLFNVTSINIYSVIGLFCFGLLIISFVLLTYQVSDRINKLINSSRKFFALIILTSIIFYFTCNNLINCNGYIVVFLFLYVISFRFLSVSEFGRITLSSTIFLLILFSLFSTYIVYQSSNKTEKEARLMIAQKLAIERDYASEFMFNEIISKAQNDTVLINQMNNYPFSDENDLNKAETYIKRNYFSSYWDRYDLLFTLCDSAKVLDIQPEDYIISCFDYFENLINENGKKTNCPNLYYIDFDIAADNYIGIINLPSAKSSVRIYVEVFSKLITRGLGYPELLLDQNTRSSPDLTHYSWARYEKNELIYHFGKYFFSMNLLNYKINENNKNFFNRNGYSHLLYHVDEDTQLIISRKNPGLIDIASPFSYFFIFYGFLILLVLFFLKSSYNFRILILNFKKRLQLSIISLILISFIFIGLSSLFYIISLNSNKNFELLSEKSHSVLIELEHKLASEESLTLEMEQYLSDLLYKFSLVFFSDINLYDLNGTLLATSRPEIFNKGLISEKMNSEAFSNMNNFKKSQFIQNESIGEYKYLSAYLPFRNDRNKIIAYLNLPYFAKQDELTNEISTYLVAFINIYVILIAIAISITLVVSNYITKPVQIIKDKISKLKLGKSNEKIEWSKNDEIGSLVLEYNKMVDKLAQSAELLAKSERDSAWREMAKQIAHEIKNPLTPMKLSVQYLQKAWDEKAPDWDQRLKRFTQTIVEQIESLSTIASEFSDFAKKPKSKFEKTELNKVIDNSIRLFKDSTSILFNFSHTGPHFVLADKEQLLRVFINLINNSIQAITDPEQGEIKITVAKESGYHVIKFTDNGKGIPSDQKNKVFYPNFTTKSGGMGLGLAVVKNLIQNSNGEITFESEEGKGTTFMIVLPDYTE